MTFFSVNNFRIFSFIEAASFLILLFIAMPLKYLAHFPAAVSIVGTIHGAIFLAYLGFVAIIAGKEKWRPGSIFGALAAGVLPFGPFAFDRMVLKKKEA